MKFGHKATVCDYMLLEEEQQQQFYLPKKYTCSR